MTIADALTVAVQVPGIDTNTIEKSCIDQGLTSSENYTKSDETSVDTAAVNVLKSLLVQSQSEGGFTYSISPTALKERISQLERKLGIDSDSRPIVKAVNKW